MIRLGESDERERDMRMLLRDWRQALRTPHVYRVGNSTLRLQHQFFGVLLIVVIVPLIFYSYSWIQGNVCTSNIADYAGGYRRYNATYPITPPVKTAAGVSYRIGIISDLDKESKDNGKKNTWYSVFKKGRLFWMARNNFISVTWDTDEAKLTSEVASNGRGMELSELVTFDGRLVTFDDRTGIVYYLDGDQAFPWLILMDGSGKDTKGF